MMWFLISVSAIVAFCAGAWWGYDVGYGVPRRRSDGPVIPSWDECRDAVGRGNPTALEAFIYNHEPGAGDAEFREQLWAALLETTADTWNADSAPALSTERGQVDSASAVEVGQPPTEWDRQNAGREFHGAHVAGSGSADDV